MTKEEFTRLREIELEILHEFEQVCEKLNLTYFCIYGTALGAIRHKGFIPWDDDLDVGMPREDYEIFMEKAQDLLPSNYFVQNHRKEREYLNPFGKLRRSDTTFLQVASRDKKINHGVYIDIFPLDGYPTMKLAEFMFKWKRLVYNSYIFADTQGNMPEEISGRNKILVQLGRFFMGKMTPWEAVDKKDKMVRKMPYATSKIVGVMVDDNPTKEAMPKEYFGQGTLVEFEGCMTRVPENWDEYLTHAYGNYMEFPPEEDRHPIHVCEIIDFDRSYTYYENHFGTS